MTRKAEVTHEIKDHLAIIGMRGEEWSLQLNLVSWNGNAPKYDIRPWNKDRSKCGTGITMTEEELRTLGSMLNQAGWTL